MGANSPMSVVNAILVNVAVAMEGEKSVLAAAGMAGLAAQTGMIVLEYILRS